MTSVQAILLGLLFGAIGASGSALFLLFTRPFRRTNNRLALGAGILVIGGSALCSVYILFYIGDRLGIGRDSSLHYASLYAYTASYLIIAMLGLRAESRWRKSIGQ